jgi:AraC-like DNA-binding protein/quercetin dioxygenase-like cupin family protein
MMHGIRKREGFEGQKAIVLPKKIREVCSYTPPVNSLYITDIGFYPRATFHYRERPQGVSQNIFIYCTEGKGWVEVPAGKFAVNPNEYIIIPADMPHKYGADEESPWTIHWVHFKGTQSPSYASLLSKELREFVTYSPFLDERIRIFDSIYKALESGYSLDNLMFSAVSFSYFLASFSFTDKFASAHHTIEKDAVDISIEYMQNHLDSPLSLEVIASSINLSVSHYSSIFRKKTGYSPIVYFNHLKIQHACQYLQFTTLRVNEIASKLGVLDQYYFSRMFTKIMGISPLEYRNRKH